MAKILLIDDDRSMHQIVSLFLEPSGHHVHSAMNGLAGLQLVALDRPDLILLDMALPGMDGADVLRALKTKPETADIPVMAFTVFDRDELPEGLDQHGLAGHLQKPVDLHTLEAGVDLALHHPDLLH